MNDDNLLILWFSIVYIVCVLLAMCVTVTATVHAPGADLVQVSRWNGHAKRAQQLSAQLGILPTGAPTMCLAIGPIDTV